METSRLHLIPDLRMYSYVAVDLETTGLRFWADSIVAVAISLPDGLDFCLDFREPEVQRWCKDQLPKMQLWVNQNIKFDAHFLRAAGIDMSQVPVADTMVFAALLDEHLLKYDLDYLGKKYLGVGKDTDIYSELAKIFGGQATKNAQAKNLGRAPWELLSKYAVQDTRTACSLYEWQLPQLAEQQLMQVAALEMRLLPVLEDMEFRGVRVDLDRAERAMSEITAQVLVKQEKLNRVAGFPVNPNPSASIKKLFDPTWVTGEDGKGYWRLVDGTRCELTDAGKASIDADCLRRMQHPAAKMILDLRTLLKTRDTFLKGHILGHHHNGVIHANFNQTKSDNDLGTGTGRLSCNDPALQQIHKRNKEVAAVVRAIFLPDEGQDWGCRDWSQMDFRVFAHYAGNPRILRMYAENPELDFHQMVADLTGLPRSMTPGIKGNAKQINLGLVFGMGEGKLAQEMGLPYTEEEESRGKMYLRAGEEALAVFEQYHSEVPGIKSLLARASSVAKSRGYVKTALGRRIRFPNGQFTHKAGGLIFQGTAADALKTKIVEAYNIRKGTEARLLINVHDELDTSMPKGPEGERIAEAMRASYECFDGVGCHIQFKVPIRSSYGSGPNWWEASK